MRFGISKYAAGLAVPFFFAATAMSDDFNLNSAKLSDVREKASRAAPAAVASAAQPVRAVSTIDMSIKLPFSVLNKAFAGSDPSIKVQNPNLPVLVPNGDAIHMSNLLVNLNGIKVEPTVDLKPYFEGPNKLAIKITHVDVNIFMSPDKSTASSTASLLDKNEIMAMVMEQVTGAIVKQVGDTLAENKISASVSSLVAFKYDKDTWVEHIIINPGCASAIMPKMRSNLNVLAFNFDKNGMALAVKLEMEPLAK